MKRQLRNENLSKTTENAHADSPEVIIDNDRVIFKVKRVTFKE